MTSTYSNLGVELQGTGDNSNTWGTIANGDFSMLDAAVAGVYNLSVGSTSQTITVTNGAVSSARSAVLYVTGSPGGNCTITVAPNTMQKTYDVINATTGGFNLIFTQGSGSTVTVRNGTGTRIYCDGGGATANVRDIFADVDFDSAKVAGTAVVTSGRLVSAGTGLTGGGDLSADRTLALATIANNNILGNVSGSTAAPIALTGTQVASTFPTVSETQASVAEVATQTEVDTGTDDVRFITPLKFKTSTITFDNAHRGAVTALGTSGTVTIDMATGNNFSMAIAGTVTLANPTNQTAGQSGQVVITQDGTGGRTMSYGTNWKFEGGTAPTLTTTASAVDVLVYYVESASRITAKLLKDVK